MKIIGCIPSRYASTRLPGKPLCDIAGKPMVLHVLERAKQAKQLHDVVVLTDDERILNTIIEAGHHAVMTSTECHSGTDRIAEYMNQHSDADVFVNIQGDEVLLDPDHIDKLTVDFINQQKPTMGTLAHHIHDKTIMSDPHTVKVVTRLNGNALYFSRSCIPLCHNGDLPEQALGHIGVYIYTRATLQAITSTERTPLEQTESLEQLRALENDIDIHVTVIEDFHSLSVDTPADLKKAQSIFTS
ncbi:MAG: 3-deoxy-manno-octulosonate cytidylyltransferase [Gammaproteobacteria bacterium]|nr:3-deoxy-manno-octulosonate cytidylyltransferase [Gammaproteobacteria bacterium]MCK5262987.1 3-deoxy-manno-octulosonate cytidylyltransferase [Gammaproteobacteria bacterium]